MAEINLFNGGLNSLKDARKLDPNECLEMVDADISSGSVISLPDVEFIEQKIGTNFIDYKGHIVSADGEHHTFAKMYDYLFKCEGAAPRYTLGMREYSEPPLPGEKGRLLWYEMGLPAPTQTISVKLTETDKIKFHYDQYGGAAGAMKGGETYQYMVLSEGLSYTQNFTCDMKQHGKCLQIDASGFSSVQGIYRKFKGAFCKIKGSEASKKVRDFGLGTGSYPYSHGSSTVVVNPMPNYLSKNIGFVWSGNGSVTITIARCASWGGLSKPQVLNFKTGAASTNKAFCPTDNAGYETLYTIYSTVESVTDDKRVAGMKKFRINLTEYVKGFAMGYIIPVAFTAILEVSFSGYKVISGSVINTPRRYDLPVQDYENSVGDDIEVNNHSARHMKGDFEYAITYLTTTGAESAAGPTSTLISSQGDAITVSIPKITKPDDSTDRINLYRRNSSAFSGSLEFYLVKTFKIAETPTTFVDNTKIEDLGKLMPVRTLGTVPSDSLYFTEHKGRLFTATKDYNYKKDVYTPKKDAEYPKVPHLFGDVYTATALDKPYTYKEGFLKGSVIENGDKILYRDGGWVLFNKTTTIQDFNAYFTLRYSNLGRPNEWDQLNYLNVSHSITGLGSSANGLIVFHETSTYVLLNTATESFTFRKISGSQGCIEHRSIQSYQGSIISASTNGITVTNGGELDLISYPKLGAVDFKDSIIGSAIVSENYFLLFSGERILRLDLTDRVFTLLDAAGVEGIAGIDGKLLITKHEDLYHMPFQAYRGVHGINAASRADKTFSYTSGLITEQSLSNLKEYDKVRVVTEGLCYLTVLIDDVVVLNLVELPDYMTMVGIPNENNKGYTIQFDVTGRGKLHSIEYSVKGRENG